MVLETDEHAFTVLGKMKQTVNTKKTLGRVWFRYFQLYGMTDKLTTACMKIGWTHTDRENYADDLKWLSSHPEVSRSGKAP